MTMLLKKQQSRFNSRLNDSLEAVSALDSVSPQDAHYAGHGTASAVRITVALDGRADTKLEIELPRGASADAAYAKIKAVVLSDMMYHLEALAPANCDYCTAKRVSDGAALQMDLDEWAAGRDARVETLLVEQLGRMKGGLRSPDQQRNLQATVQLWEFLQVGRAPCVRIVCVRSVCVHSIRAFYMRVPCVHVACLQCVRRIRGACACSVRALLRLRVSCARVACARVTRAHVPHTARVP